MFSERIFFTSFTQVREGDVALHFTRGSKDEFEKGNLFSRNVCNGSAATALVIVQLFFSFQKAAIKKLSLLVYQIVLRFY